MVTNGKRNGQERDRERHGTESIRNEIDQERDRSGWGMVTKWQRNGTRTKELQYCLIEAQLYSITQSYCTIRTRFCLPRVCEFSFLSR